MIKFSYSHEGQKPENQDSLSFGENVYVICDGVGGANRGEVASSVITESLVEYAVKPYSSELQIQNSLKKAIQRLHRLVEQEPDFTGTATTLAAVFINTNQGVFTSHVGDSRIFIVRPSNKKFWHTWDHSLVGDLVKNGEISREEGRKHPMNNRIYRAIKGGAGKQNPDSEIHHISDIKEGDRIFICSDGVLEAYSDLDLLELLWDIRKDAKEIFSEIREGCNKRSIDNNTAILLEIQKGDFAIRDFERLNWSSKKDLRSSCSNNDKKISIKKWTRNFMSSLVQRKR